MAKMSVEITVDPQSLARVQKALSDIKGGFQRAIVGAVNDTKKKLVTHISYGIRERVNIKKRDIDQYLRGTKATKYQKSARAKVVLSESARIGLKDFGARVIKKSKPPRRGNLHTMTELQRMKLTGGVRYQIEKGGGKKLIRDAFMPPALGHHVFRREGRSRLPIIKLRGPSPWGVFVVSGMKAKTKAAATEFLEESLRRRVKYEVLKHEGEI